MADFLDFFKAFQEKDEQLEIKLASSTLGERYPTISTGSFALDDALGGGLPLGRLIQYYGVTGGGKTLMAMMAIKEAQKLNTTSFQVFIDAEGTFDTNWASTLGLDTSRVLIIKGDLAVNGRRCFEMLLGVPKEDLKHKLVGKSTDGLFDKIIKKELDVNLVVLDSLGAIIPPGEDTARVGSTQMARMARFLTDAVKKLALEVGKAKIPMIIINHKRDSMDMYVDHTHMGGNAYVHHLSCNIYFTPSGGKEGILLNDQEERIGSLICATVEKSKFSPHPRKAYFRLHFGQGVHMEHEEICDLALKYGLAVNTSPVMISFGDESFRGKQKFYDYIAESKSAQETMKEKIIDARIHMWDTERDKQLKILEEKNNMQSEALEDLVKTAKKTTKKTKEVKEE